MNISKILLVLSLLLTVSFAQAQLMNCAIGEMSFYSKTPLENISAVNKKVIGTISTTNNGIAIRALMKDFDFPNELMEEHFNENYVESEKFPKATFAGKINEIVDYAKAGSYKISATGKLEIHGVSKPRTINGMLTVNKDGSAMLVCDFQVVLEDHDVKRPEVVLMKIADKMDCKASLLFIPKK
jgi:polyisoprenoid-binding protein YceI